MSETASYIFVAKCRRGNGGAHYADLSSPANDFCVAYGGPTAMLAANAP